MILQADARTSGRKSFAGVVAPDAYQAENAIRDLPAKWEAPDRPSDTDLQAYLRSHPTEEQGWEGAFEAGEGDSDLALAKAAATYEQTFTAAYLAHAPLEPRARCASRPAAGLTVLDRHPAAVWRPRTVGRGTRLAVPENVRVIVPPTGSGYGGKHTGDAAIEAARLARAAGQPVKVAGAGPRSSPWPTSGPPP